MLEKIKKMRLLLALGLFMGSIAARAEAAAGSVEDLWTKLDVNFTSLFQDVFTALKTPVGAVLAVVFVIAVFYFCAKMAKNAINKRQSL